MAPHFLSGEKKKKKRLEGEFTWFETAVNGGALILSILRDASNLAPVPYLRGAALTTLTIIQIGQVSLLIHLSCNSYSLFRQSRITGLIFEGCAKTVPHSPLWFSSPANDRKILMDGQEKDSKMQWTAS